MAGQQRKCANCRFFSDAGMPGNGWCTHPKRQLNSGVKLLVRGGELACRNSWGGDLFQSRLDDEATPAATADLPGDDRDDQVTSVTIPTTRTEPAEDRVVRDRPAAQRFDPADSNDAAHRDQAERARIMARGSRDAVAQARQRYSTRRQPLQQDDVVADDDVHTEGSDRVVTRQGRFSDRDFAAGLPHMRTEPVPREEIHQRISPPEDRFDTVPAIDPDFDMPGQRRQTQPPAPPAAADEPEAPEDQSEADAYQLTAYEHVLQRARRIRATKLDRAQPIRHADVLLGRGDRAAIEAPDIDEPAGYRQVEDWRDEHVDAEATPEPETYAAYDDVAPWHVAEEDVYEAIVDEPDAGGAWDDDVDDDEVATAWADEDDAWIDDDAEPLYEPEPRRPGWLSRFRIGQRPLEPSYDDATITRHAESSPSYLDDEPIDDDPRSHRDSDRVPSWSDADDTDLPDWRDTTSARVYAEELPAPAPVPPPVPASERTGDAWGTAGMPARPVATSRPRQHLMAELPDLEDALFDDIEDRAPRAERPASRRAEPAGNDTLGSASPRDSFFRASRYPQYETTAPFRESPEPDARGLESTLPNLDGDRLDMRDVVARGAELLDRRIEVAPDVPRQCRTCRSFRSADGGTRGWCTNEWAFTHRRMVNDDDLACVSAIGCWWLPADHLRLDLDDDSEDVRTPRMDELIATQKPAARRVSGG